jgi:hypothetical protein
VSASLSSPKYVARRVELQEELERLPADLDLAVLEGFGVFWRTANVASDRRIDVSTCGQGDDRRRLPNRNPCSKALRPHSMGM